MKRARLTAGWLKQKPITIALLLVMLVSMFGGLSLILIPSHAAAAGPPSQWKYGDVNYKTLNGLDGSGKVVAGYAFRQSSTAGTYISSPDANGNYRKVVVGSSFVGQTTGELQAFIKNGTKVGTATITGIIPPDGGTGTDPGGGTVPGDGTNGDASNTDTGGQVATEDPCDASGDPLSWFICPVINMINGAITLMQKVIDNLLEFDVKTVFDRSTDTGKAYYEAWNSFRLVGIAVVVIAGLAMVITQALGLEVFDAYTVKKMVPRLFIAAIGISLSWYLLEFLATATNDIGLAVRNMIYWPFRGIGNGDTGLNSAGGFLAGDLIAGGVLFALGIAGTLSLVVTAGLAALVAFLVLIIRQMVLILLILLAPLAIALYVMPNTQKAYHLWWDSISKGFLMFPIIVAFIAIGRVFSVVAANAGGSGIHGTVNEVISVIAFFLPYFALPFTFRLAGGAIGTIAGLTNDRSRGAFDRLKKYRANQAAMGWERKKNEKLFRGGTDTNIRGKLNRGVANSINAPGAISESGNLTRPGRWGAAVRADRGSRVMSEIERNMKENTAIQGWIHNDDLARAASSTNNAGELRDYLVNPDNKLGYELGTRDLEDTVASIEAGRRSMSGDAFRAMTTRAYLAGGTAIKSSDDPTAPKTAAGEAIAAIARASVNDEALAGNLVANMRNDGMRAGRVDYAGAGFGTTIGEVQKMRKKLQNGGEITNDDIIAATTAIHDDVYASNGGYALVNAGLKPDAVKEMAPVMQRHLDTAIASGNDRDVKREMASLKGVYENLQASSPNKAKVLADGVFASRVAVQDLSPGIRRAIGRDKPEFDNQVMTNAELMQAMSGDSEFREFHREWGEAAGQHEAEYEQAMQNRQASAGEQGRPPGPGMPPGQ